MCLTSSAIITPNLHQTVLVGYAFSIEHKNCSRRTAISQSHWTILIAIFGFITSSEMVIKNFWLTLSLSYAII